MKKRLSTLLLLLIFFTGLAVLLYPSVSNYWNSLHQSRAIAAYSDNLARMTPSDYAGTWAAVEAFNRSLPAGEAPDLELEPAELDSYHALLDATGTGIMGYIEIPSIEVELPIYHGVDESVLQIAVGHLPGTSLPGGGPGTHTVLSGHRGLPSSRLFTDLDRLAEGDEFYLHILNRVLAYRVDQIKIVLPYELDDLAIAPGRDYCTLVTCTPYGVNSHRLLVRGVRTQTVEEAAPTFVFADAVQIEPVLVAPVVAAPILFVLLLVMLAGGGKGRKKRHEDES